MTIGAHIVAKRVDNAWKSYAAEVRDRYGIEGAPKRVQERWASIEPIIEHAFKRGAASGGIISAEIAKSMRNS